ncbi:MAG: hypothetical protein U0Y68_19205 [Blastocatellia bacterium]
MAAPLHLANRTLTREGFAQLLAQLDGDPERAARRYLDLRDRLLYFFESKQCDEPAAWADEVINRLIWRLQEGEVIQQIDAYALGIARFVLKEYFRHQPPLVTLEDLLPADDWYATQQAEERVQRHSEQRRLDDAMRQCLLTLPAPMRELLIAYYDGQGRSQTERRRALAKAQGVSENALYLKIHRIRERLEQTLLTFLAQDEHKPFTRPKK